MLTRNLALLLIVASALSLSGCLLTRVYAFKEQFCDYQQNFRLQVADGISLQMRNPVLYDADVIWLLGAQPTRQTSDGDRKEMVFVVEKDIEVSDPGYAIPLRLVFTRQGGRYRLSEGIIDMNLGTVITPGLIEETVAHTCDSETSVLARNVTVDLSDLDPASIPRRSVIEQALGEPTRNIGVGPGPGHRVEYRYRLQGAGPEVEKTTVQLWFAADGETVDRIQFRYLRYELDADFVRGVGIISIDL